MEKKKIYGFICVLVVLMALFCACQNRGDDIITPKKKDATPGISSTPVGPEDNTPTPKENDKKPTPTGTPASGTLVTAYFQNANYTYQTDSIDFEFSLDNPLFTKKDFEWTLDLKGQTIELDRTLNVVNYLTITNGTIVVKQGIGINVSVNLDKPLFESGDLGEATFIVDGGTGIMLSDVMTVSLHNVRFIVNGGVGAEVYNGGIVTPYNDDGEEETALMQVNGGIGYKVKATNDEYIYCNLPMQVEENGTGFVFEKAACAIQCDIVNNGGIAMQIDKDSSVAMWGNLMQNSGIGILNEGYFRKDDSLWLIAKAGLLLKNSGTCEDIQVASFPGTIFKETLVINENGASVTDLQIALLTAENAVGFDNKGDLYGSVKLCGGMPRGSSWGLGSGLFDVQYGDIPEFGYVSDMNYQNYFVNSKVVINRKEGRFIRFDNTYGEIVVDLNATEESTEAYPNTSVGFLNESDTPVYYQNFHFCNYGQGGVAFVNEANARLEICSEDNSRIDAWDYTFETENSGLNLRNGIIFLNKGYFNYTLVMCEQHGENGKGVVNDGTMQYVADYEGQYVNFSLELKGKNNVGLLNNSDVNAYMLSLNVDGEKNTGFLNYSTAEFTDSLTGVYCGHDNIAVHNTSLIKSPVVRMSSTYLPDDKLAAKNCTGLLNECDVLADLIEINSEYSSGGRGLSNASSGKITVSSLKLQIHDSEDIAENAVICYNEGEIKVESTNLNLGGNGTTILMNAGTFRADTITGFQEYDHAHGTFISNTGVITVTDSLNLYFDKKNRDSYMHDSGSSAFLGSVYIAYHEWDMEKGDVTTVLVNR